MEGKKEEEEEDEADQGRYGRAGITKGCGKEGLLERTSPAVGFDYLCWSDRPTGSDQGNC